MSTDASSRPATVGPTVTGRPAGRPTPAPLPGRPRPIECPGRRPTVDGHRVRYGVVGSGPPALFLHGWGLRPNAYARAHRGDGRRRLPGGRSGLPGFGGTPSCRPRSGRSPGTAPGWPGSSTRSASAISHWWPATRSAVGCRPPSSTTSPSGCPRSCLANAIGSPTWALFPNEVRTMMQRPFWDWGRHFGGDLLQSPRAAAAPADPARGLRRPTWCATRSACSAPASSSAGPTWWPRSATIAARGIPVSVAWSDRDGLVPRSAFDELRRAAGVEGVVVEGSHAWLIADPDGLRRAGHQRPGRRPARQSGDRRHHPDRVGPRPAGVAAGPRSAPSTAPGVA